MRDLPHLVSLLAPSFLSTSLGIAPNAQAGAGNRTFAHTSQTFQQIRVALTAGVAHVLFKNPFPDGVLPVISLTPEGVPPSSGTTLYIVKKSRTNRSIGIASTDNTDARTVHVTASMPPG